MRRECSSRVFPPTAFRCGALFHSYSARSLLLLSVRHRTSPARAFCAMMSCLPPAHCAFASSLICADCVLSCCPLRCDGMAASGSDGAAGAAGSEVESEFHRSRASGCIGAGVRCIEGSEGRDEWSQFFSYRGSIRNRKLGWREIVANVGRIHSTFIRRGN